MENIIKEIIFTGKALYQQGLVNTHAGNISVYSNGKIYITKTGSMLGYLTEENIIDVYLYPSNKDKTASRELIVHREIYKKTNAKAVIHAHPIHMVSLSFNLKDKFVPIDSEGELFIGEVPIIEVEPPSSSPELAERVSSLMINYDIVVVKRHGSFVKASSLNKALQLTSDLEYCANVYTLVKKL